MSDSNAEIIEGISIPSSAKSEKMDETKRTRDRKVFFMVKFYQSKIMNCRYIKALELKCHSKWMK
jgi:hypothetical protein